MYVGDTPTAIPFDIPWSSQTEISALNTTGLPHTVEATSEGKVKIHFRWMGMGSAPSRVLVDRSANASAAWTSAGTGLAINGLGTPAVTEQNSVVAAGMRKKVYDGSSGTFYVEIELKANSQGSTRASVSASANATVIDRGVYIYALNRERNYRRTLTGRTIYSHGGSYPEAVPELVLPEENSAGELFHTVQVGLPIVTRDYYDFYGPYTHIDATAATFGDHYPTESFQWHTPMDNTSGTLPGPLNDFTF